MGNYILIYDLPRSESSSLVKVNRELHKINAKKLQHSVWQSSSLENLKEIAKLIKQNGGQAMILEEKIVFKSAF